MVAMITTSCTSNSERYKQKEVIVLEKIPVDSIIHISYVYGSTKMVQFNKNGYLVTLTGVISNVQDTVLVHKISSLKRIKINGSH